MAHEEELKIEFRGEDGFNSSVLDSYDVKIAVIDLTPLYYTLQFFCIRFAMVNS